MFEIMQLLAVLIIVIYGCCWAVGGPGFANKVLRRIGRGIWRFIRQLAKIVAGIVGEIVVFAGKVVIELGRAIPRLLP